MVKYAMAIDLRKCTGCGACVVACQIENNQKPGISWNELDVVEWGVEPGVSGRAYIPHACMQCENPPCVAVCPTAASYQREDGITMIDYDACIACGYCMSACPYNARTLSNVKENMFHAHSQAPYETYEVQRKFVAEKCMFCEGRLEEGRLPSCVVDCPGRARYFGDLEDPESPVSQFIKHSGALRIDETSFYYQPGANMPEEALPFAATSESVKREKADPGIDPAAIGVVATAAVAAGTGIGVGVSRSKKKERENNGQ